MMNSDLIPTSRESCEAIQYALSEGADEGRPIPADIREHLQTCPECARFARLWVDHDEEGFRDLAAPIATSVAAELRQQILAHVAETAAQKPAPIPFPAPTAVPPRKPAWMDAVSKIAAAVAIIGFAYWMLDPKAAHHSVAEHHQPATLGSKQLDSAVAAVEQPMNRERDALRNAVTSGGSQIRNAVQSSLAIFQQ